MPPRAISSEEFVVAEKASWRFLRGPAGFTDSRRQSGRVHYPDRLVAAARRCPLLVGGADSGRKNATGTSAGNSAPHLSHRRAEGMRGILVGLLVLLWHPIR